MTWKAEESYLRACAEAPCTREPWIALAGLYYASGRWAECYSAATRALSIVERDKVYTSDPESWGSKPHDYAALSAWYIGMKDEALKQGQIAIDLSPDDERLKENMRWYLGEMDVSEAAE